ncbi:MAG: alpha/beta hydrolase [Azospirillaceae bacterium]|nr:alpha/beta hydrolase [Azospirillaceae bacterium]
MPDQPSIADTRPADAPNPVTAVFGWLERPDGGRIRHARWEPRGPARATLVILQGRSEFLEKYQEQAEDWCRRGFRVLSFDWRGQGLSTRLLAARHKGHIPDYRLLLDDAVSYLETIAAPLRTGPAIVFGHSMGGHLALHLLARCAATADGRPGFSAAILAAPMLSLWFTPYPAWLARRVITAATAVGWGRCYAAGQGDYQPAVANRFPGNPLTRDPERYAVYHRGFARNPDLVLGGVTFGWLAATLRSIDRLTARGVLERITAPVLILSAPQDRVVRGTDHPVLAHRLPNAVLCRYPDAGHEILMEADAVRNRAWADIDAFLAERCGLPPFRPEPG